MSPGLLAPEKSHSEVRALGKKFPGLALLLILILGACTLQAPASGPLSPTATPTLPAATEEPAAPTQGLAATSTPESATASPTVPAGRLRAHFIDVGQGDATLIEGEDFAILIDAGRHTGDGVVPYLQSAGVEKLDLLIITHPHADHIGQVPQVMDAFPVEEVWMSGNLHTTVSFERAIDAIEAFNAGYHEPRAGERYTIGPVNIEVVNPAEINGDFHEGSVSVRITYGNVRFMFTGDAEAPTERVMIDQGHDLEAQVLQLGHHGSRTSSSVPFLAAVQPEIAIYSAGQGNTYGHPHQQIIDRLAELNIPVYGTDIHGTIVISTDGATYQVLTEREVELPPAATQAPTSTLDGCRPDQVDINTAPVTELADIIHIDAVWAEDLIDLRPFASVDELTHIAGIGPSRLQNIKEQDLACVAS
jgi:competence protein ComEC